MMRLNWHSASSMPAAVQRIRMSPPFQRFTLPCVLRTISIIDSQGLVEARVRRRRSEAPRRCTVTVSSSPSRKEAAALGDPQGVRPGRADPALHPRALDGHPPPAERHLAVFVAVAHGAALRVVLPLRAADLGDLGLHQLVHDAQPHPDREGEQPLFGGAGEIAERLLHGLRQLLRRCPVGRGDLRGGYLLHWRFLLSRSGLVRARHASSRSGRGGRIAVSSSTGYGTTSSSVAGALLCPAIGSEYFVRGAADAERGIGFGRAAWSQLLDRRPASADRLLS